MIKYIFDKEKNGEESYWGMRAAIDTVIREGFSEEGHLRSKRQDGTSQVKISRKRIPGRGST